MPLTEAILRLTDAGDTGLDVGANIGYMSLVMARSAGPRGRVVCFEPNAEVIPTLRKNASDWVTLGIAPIEVQTIALSDRDGEGSLAKARSPTEYGRNQGVASLEVPTGGKPVRVCRLDSIFSGNAGVMKVDVEGHEVAVFAGARNLLEGKLIRDVLFAGSRSEWRPRPLIKYFWSTCTLSSG